MKKYLGFGVTAIISTLILLCLNITTAIAGTSCKEKASNPALLAHAGERAVSVKNTLDHLHPQVALLARVGSNLEKYHIYYTHAAFVVRDFPGRKGQWTVLHLLNQCGTGNSSIYEQGLFNFFMDDLYNMDFRIIVPKPELQQKLYAVLRSQLKLQLHDANYSKIAYPFSTRYQNSNQWVLEVLTAANFKVNSREAAQQILQQSGYIPMTIKVSTMSQLGASLFEANIKFDDHPQQERQTRSYSVVTVDSVTDYLRHLGKLAFDKSYPAT